jgi:hypothetical protein
MLNNWINKAIILLGEIMGKSKRQLHVFENEVPESIIAYDVEDAIKVWEETIGEKYNIEESGGEFEQVSDDRQYTLYEEETINPEPIPEGAVLVSSSEFSYTYKATCRAWADARGRCYLGSAEY